jgi:hypothetical protein
MPAEANEAPAWSQLETTLTGFLGRSYVFSFLAFFSAAIVPMLLTSVTIQSHVGGLSPSPATFVSLRWRKPLAPLRRIRILLQGWRILFVLQQRWLIFDCRHDENFVILFFLGTR